MAQIITRSGTVNLSFAFVDETGAEASVASAVVQLVYPGYDGLLTETITLTDESPNWTATWDSIVSRGGWVYWHAHAESGGSAEYAEDGRFKISSNEANLQHDALPSGNSGTALTDYSV